MADSFAADVREIQKYSEQWKQQASEVGKLPAQVSDIESRLGAVLESTFATDALNFLVGGSQLDNWFNLRAKLRDVVGRLDAVAGQLSQASDNLRICSVEYQFADQAAAHGFDDVYVFVDEQKYASPIQALLRSLSRSQDADVLDESGSLISENPGNVAKKVTDTGPDFVSYAHALNNDPDPEPAPAPDPDDDGGGETST